MKGVRTQDIHNDDVLIVITADEPWGAVMHTQLHFAFQLSKRYDVIYINPPRVWSPTSGFVNYKKTYRVNSRLMVIPYRHLFPVRIFRGFFTFINDILTSFVIRKHIPVGKQEIILWRFDHFRLYSAWLPGKVRTIYHVVDNYIGKPGDARLAERSDLVVVTSPRLMGHYKALNRNTVNIPQCIPKEDNEVDEDLVGRIHTKYGDFLLFVGTLSSEVDISLLDSISRTFSSVNLVVIGPVMNLSDSDLSDLKSLQSNDNVHFVGSIPGLDLKNYVKAAAVCLVPYKFQDQRSVHVRSPLKILNYISQHKPVVTSMESEIPDQVSMGIHYVNSAGEFLGKISTILSQPAVIDVAAVDQYLSESNYESRISQIMDNLYRED